MNDSETPTPPRPSALFPTVTPADYAEAEELARALATDKLPATADDVLLAQHLVGIGKHLLSDPRLESQGLAKLCNESDVGSLRAMIMLARTLTRVREGASPDLAHDAIDFMTSLTALLVHVGPKPKRPKMKHGRG